VPVRGPRTCRGAYERAAVKATSSMQHQLQSSPGSAERMIGCPLFSCVRCRVPVRRRVQGRPDVSPRCPSAGETPRLLGAFGAARPAPSRACAAPSAGARLEGEGASRLSLTRRRGWCPAVSAKGTGQARCKLEWRMDGVESRALRGWRPSRRQECLQQSFRDELTMIKRCADDMAWASVLSPEN
jgi:hypothetical protein